MKKVMIGIPAFDGASPVALENFMVLAFHLGRREPEYEFFLRVIGGKEQFRARNTLVGMAIQSQVDYLWMLDGDNVIPPDAFSKLIAHDKAFIGGLYLQKQTPHRSVMLVEDTKLPGKYRWVEEYTDGLIEVDVIGGGCMLMRVDLLEKMKEPYFVPEILKGTDVQICEKVKEQGEKVYIDTTIGIGHVCEATIIFPNDVPQYARSSGRYVEPTMAEQLRSVGEKLRNDVIEYLDLSRDQYEVELALALDEHKNIWNRRKRETKEAVEDFYREGDRNNVVRLSYYSYQSGWARTYWPEFMSPSWMKGSGINSVLDYGCGLSILSVPLVLGGFDVTSCDLPDTLQLDILRWRREKLGIEDSRWSIKSVDDLAGLSEKRFDLIMVWDVVEHLYDPWPVLDSLFENHLTETGCVMTNFHMLNFSSGDDQPQHLINASQRDFITEMNKRGFDLVAPRPYMFKRSKK